MSNPRYQSSPIINFIRSIRANTPDATSVWHTIYRIVTGATQANEGPFAGQVAYTETDTGDGTIYEEKDGPTANKRRIYRHTGDGALDLDLSKAGYTGVIGSNEHDILKAGGTDPVLLYGGGGTDMLQGGGGNDWLFGGAGNDLLVGNAGADRIDGGDGFDTAIYWNSPSGVTVDLVSGIGSGGYAEGDHLSNIENIFGSSHNDTLTGDDGNNALDGNRGNDTLDGGAGNDTLDGGGGADSLDGGAGEDWAIYSSLWVGVTVNLAQGVGSGGDAEGDRLSNIENIWGSSYSDTLIGDDGNNELVGNSGNDTLNGGAGNDTLNGGAGNDTLAGGTGDDVYVFNRGDGSDTINDEGSRAAGATPAQGGDVIKFGVGISLVNLVFWRDGDDLIIYVRDAGDPDQSLARVTDIIRIENWQAADNRIEWLTFADGSHFNLSRQTIHPLRFSIFGGAGNDMLHGGAAEDTLNGGAGNDRLEGNNGNDVLNGGAGNDRLEGDDGNDVLNGGAGNDRLEGDDGNDVLNGGAGDDRLFGDDGNDTLNGGEGENLINGGRGDDMLSGGAGDDIYLFRRGDGKDTITDTGSNAAGTRATPGGDRIGLGEGITIEDIILRRYGNDLVIYIRDPDNPNQPLSQFTDVIRIRNWATASHRIEWVQFFDDSYTKISDINSTILSTDLSAPDGGNPPVNDNLTGTATADWMDGGRGNDDLSGGAGNDRLFGGAGNDRLYGGTGDDTLYGGAGNDELSGGAGNDRLYGGADRDNMYGNAGNDDLYGGAGNDDLYGDTGNDSLYGGAGNDDLYGGAGNDDLYGDTGNDRLYGNRGNDTLDGGAGNDWLRGGAGNDTLNGGAGNDYLFGDEGNDTLIASAGEDIYHFARGDGQDTFQGSDAAGIRGTDKYILDSDDFDKEHVWFQRSGNNLVVRLLGSTDQITFTDWYDAQGNMNKHIRGFEVDGEFLNASDVQRLVNAMASFRPNDGSTGTGGISHAQLPPAVQAAVNAAWKSPATA